MKLFAKVAILGLLSIFAAAGELKIMTEEYAPFNYEENGKVTGFSTEIVEEMMKRMGIKSNIELLPWSRAYNLTMTKDDYALFSMTRTEQREGLFKWVGPLVPNKSVLWGLADKEYDIKNLNDAKKYKIGAYKDDADEQFLKENGFNIDSVVNDEQNLKKLLSGRIDLWIGGDPAVLMIAKKAGEADKIKRVFTAKEAQMYLAFSKNTPQEVIEKWQSTLDELKKDGFYDKVSNKYFK